MALNLILDKIDEYLQKTDTAEHLLHWHEEFVRLVEGI